MIQTFKDLLLKDREPRSYYLKPALRLWLLVCKASLKWNEWRADQPAEGPLKKTQTLGLLTCIYSGQQCKLTVERKAFFIPQALVLYFVGKWSSLLPTLQITLLLSPREVLALSSFRADRQRVKRLDGAYGVINYQNDWMIELTEVCQWKGQSC